MGQFRERYVVDDDGNRIEVLLELEQFKQLLTDLEELESIRAYDAAKAAGDEAVPLDQALDEIEQERS